MEKRFVVFIIAVFLLSSCSLIDSADIGNDDQPDSGVQNTLFIPVEGGAIPVPMAIDEDITCTHYAAPDGDDSADGTALQPWASVQFAVDSAKPGDVVCFREGIYRLEEAAKITKSGTPETPIVFIAYPGEQPVLDGGGDIGELVIFKQGASHLRFSGFTLQNFRIWGIEVSGGNSYLHFDHLEIAGGETAIRFTYGDSAEGPPSEGPVEYITLEESLIHGSVYSAVDCTPGPCSNMIIRRVEVFDTGLSGQSYYGSDGIEFARGYPVLVEDCYVHDNGGDGIDLNSRDRDGHATGVIVRRNRVVRNHLNGIKLWAGGRIENNIVWGQGNSAIWSGTFHSTLEIINNTIAYNMWDRVYSERNWAVVVGYPEEISEPQVDLTLVNNIIAFNTGPKVGDPTGIYLGSGVDLTEYHNLYFSSEDGEITAEFLDWEFTRQELIDGRWSEQTKQGIGDLFEDPLFLPSWSETEMQVQTGSPVIDAGDNSLCPTEDALGNPRPVDGDDDENAVCDIGAVEWRE